MTSACSEVIKRASTSDLPSPEAEVVGWKDMNSRVIVLRGNFVLKEEGELKTGVESKEEAIPYPYCD